MNESKPENGRRKESRRKKQQPFAGEDCRKAERRSGHDRRSEPREPTDS